MVVFKKDSTYFFENKNIFGVFILRKQNKIFQIAPHKVR